jgi:hypothetical protein
VLNARTLQPLRTQIALPSCGGGELATAGNQIAVLCYGAELRDGNRGPSELRFVDPSRLVVTARVRMSDESYGLVVSRDQKYVYVGGLHVAKIDAASHQVKRDVDYIRKGPFLGAAPFEHAFDVTSDGGQVLIGLLKDRSDPTSPYVLQPYRLPGLLSLPLVNLPSLVHFVAASGNQLITFPMLESRTHDWTVNMLDLQTGQSRQLFVMNGPVLQIVVSHPL